MYQLIKKKQTMYQDDNAAVELLDNHIKII